MSVVRRSKINLFVFLSILLIINSIFIGVLYKHIPTLSQMEIISPSQVASASTNQTDYVLTKKLHFDDRLGAMNGIMIQDKLAYITVENEGLMIFNITNLEEPVLLGSYYDPGETYNVYIREDVAFVAAGEKGLLILNVSNPLVPFKISRYKEVSYWKQCYGVSVEDNYAYLRCGDYLIILDITDLSSPVKVSEEEYIGARDIQVINRIVFLPRLTSTFVINASNPFNQEIMSLLDNTHLCMIQDNHLFTVGGSNNLVIYNLTTLPSLTIIANYTLPLYGSAKYLTSNDNFAFIGSTEEIVKIDISDIFNPYFILNISNLNWFYNLNSIWIKRRLVTLNDTNMRNILLFTDYQRGLFIHDFSRIDGNTLVKHYDCGMRTKLIRTTKNYIFTISRVEWPYYPSRMEIYKMKKGVPVIIGTYYTDLNINDIVLSNDFVFLASGKGVDVVDISNPSNPTRISYNEFYFPGNPFPIWNVLYDNEKELIYLCSDRDGLLILNATNLLNLTLISQISDIHGYPFRAYDVFIYNDIAFVSDVNMFGGFGIIKVSDPENPRAITYVPLNRGILGIQVQDDLAYLTSYYRTLEIFNVSDIKNPVKLNELSSNGYSSGQFHLTKNYYFTAQLSNLTIVNITDPLNPYVIRYLLPSLSSIYVDVFIEDSLMYLACAWGGIEIWELPYTPLPPNWINIFLITSLTAFSFSFILVLVIVIRRKKPVKPNLLSDGRGFKSPRWLHSFIKKNYKISFSYLNACLS